MVVIRLSRSGNKNRPYFNVVVADSRKPRDGRFIERIGYFNPFARSNEVAVKFDDDKLKAWLAKGAQLSDRLKKLCTQYSKQSVNNSAQK